MKVMKLHMKVEKIVRGLRAEFHCYNELPLPKVKIHAPLLGQNFQKNGHSGPLT